MKFLCLSIIVSFAVLCVPASAQSSGSRSNAGPTAAEIEALIKQAQDRLGTLGAAPKQAKPAAVAPKLDLTAATLPGYLQRVQSAVQGKIKPEIVKELEKDIAAATNATAQGQLAAAATGFWMLGNPEAALHLMGSVLIRGALSPDNLNNYGAFLTMAGAPGPALPILDLLNRQYPSNSTVLNNIGQAWLALGDLEKAERAFDGAVRVFSAHSQANLGKATIAESKGNKPAAVEALKTSIKQAYSAEKESRLRENGYRVKHSDITFNPPKKDDGLGLGRFVQPAWPVNVGESQALEPEWREAVQQAQEEMNRHKRWIAEAQKDAIAEAQQMQVALVNAALSGRNVRVSGVFHDKAKLKLEYVVSEGTRREKQLYAELQKAMIQSTTWKSQLEKDLEALSTKFGLKFGEGMSREVPRTYCNEQTRLKNKFLKDANELVESQIKPLLIFQRTYYDDQLTLLSYMLSEKSFNLAKLEFKMKWLDNILGALQVSGTVQFQEPGEFCKEEAKKPKKAKLADFDDVACTFTSTFSVPMIGTIVNKCGRMTTNLDVSVGGVGIKGSLKQKLDQGTFTGTVQIGATVGEGKVGKGPVEAGAEVKAGGFVEFDEGGITDIGVEAGVEVKVEVSAGEGISDGKSAGATARVGWNSGATAGGTGVLEGMSTK